MVADAPCAFGNLDEVEVAAVGEGGAPDVGGWSFPRDRPQPRARAERQGTDGIHGGRDDYAFQRGTAEECLGRDGAHAFGNDKGRGEGDSGECQLADGGHVAGNAGRGATLHECAGGSFDDGVAVVARIVHRISRVDADGGAEAATPKGASLDAGDACRNGDGRHHGVGEGMAGNFAQAFHDAGAAAAYDQFVGRGLHDGVAVIAGVERLVPLVHRDAFQGKALAQHDALPDAEDILGNVEGLEADASGESARPAERLERPGQGDGGQVGAIGEGARPDFLHAFRYDEAVQ